MLSEPGRTPEPAPGEFAIENGKVSVYLIKSVAVNQRLHKGGKLKTMGALLPCCAWKLIIELVNGWEWLLNLIFES